YLYLYLHRGFLTDFTKSLVHCPTIFMQNQYYFCVVFQKNHISDDLAILIRLSTLVPTIILAVEA
ncbi:MAG: hypothetical protein ACE1ZG_02275, partial [Gammaproteobacteria bacterium]